MTFNLFSSPCALPISYINFLLNVDAVFIAACQEILVPSAKRTPAGPSYKHIPLNSIFELLKGSSLPTHIFLLSSYIGE